MKRAWMLAAIGLLTAILALGAIACSDDDEDDDTNGDIPTAVSTDPSGDATEPSDDATEPADDATEPADGGEEPGGFTTVVATDHPTLGTILTTFDGYTVYTFDNDSEGSSSCTGDCASLWPPLPTVGEPSGGDGVPGELGTISRDDGPDQVTYDGKPLYLYSADPSPGDANGDGVGGTWHVVSLD